MSWAAAESAPLRRSTTWQQGSSACDDLALFHRTLSELCRAQVPLSRALRLLHTDLRQSRLRDAVAQMADEVDQGIPLGEAYQRHQNHFPALYRALVEAGIAAGNLPGVLDEIARHAHDRARVAGRLRSALSYPLVAAVFVLAIGLLLVLFVGPQLRQAVDAVAFDAAPTTGASTMPPWATGPLAAFILLLTAASLAGLVWRRRAVPSRSLPGGITYRLPVIGQLRLYAAKASFASTMALLARRNLPLRKALELATAATDDRGVRDSIAAMAASAAAGASLNEAMRAGDLISPSLLWLIEAAESRGSAADALDDVARIYGERLDRAIDRLCTLATPIAELVLGLMVLGFALTYLLPILRFAGQVAKG